MFIGGRFAISTLMVNIAKYSPQNQSGWQPLAGGGLNDAVNVMATLQNLVFVGGDFTSTALRDKPLQHIAIYNSSSDSWMGLAGGVNASPTSIRVDESGAFVRFVGPFTRVFASSFVDPVEHISGALDLSASFQITTAPSTTATNMIVDVGRTTSTPISSNRSQIVMLDANGVAGAPSIPPGVTIVRLVWDTSRAIAYMVCQPNNPTSGLIVASMDSNGTSFRPLGIEITNGQVLDMIYLATSDQIVLAGSFKSVKQASNAVTATNGLCFIDTLKLTVTTMPGLSEYITTD
eukprot:jgi/Hompol1/989/HPOL_002628-RA